MAGNRLFNPGDSLSIRGPLDNSRFNRNVVNPPRFSEFSGLNAPHKIALYRNQAGIYRNELDIRRPGASLRDVPFDKNTGQAGPRTPAGQTGDRTHNSQKSASV